MGGSSLLQGQATQGHCPKTIFKVKGNFLASAGQLCDLLQMWHNSSELRGPLRSRSPSPQKKINSPPVFRIERIYQIKGTSRATWPAHHMCHKLWTKTNICNSECFVVAPETGSKWSINPGRTLSEFHTGLYHLHDRSSNMIQPSVVSQTEEIDFPVEHHVETYGASIRAKKCPWHPQANEKKGSDFFCWQIDLSFHEVIHAPTAPANGFLGWAFRSTKILIPSVSIIHRLQWCSLDSRRKKFNSIFFRHQVFDPLYLKYVQEQTQPSRFQVQTSPVYETLAVRNLALVVVLGEFTKFKSRWKCENVSVATHHACRITHGRLRSLPFRNFLLLSSLFFTEPCCRKTRNFQGPLIWTIIRVSSAPGKALLSAKGWIWGDKWSCQSGWHFPVTCSTQVLLETVRVAFPWRNDGHWAVLCSRLWGAHLRSAPRQTLVTRQRVSVCALQISEMRGLGLERRKSLLTIRNKFPDFSGKVSHKASWTFLLSDVGFSKKEKPNTRDLIHSGPRLFNNLH